MGVVRTTMGHLGVRGTSQKSPWGLEKLDL